MEREGCKRVRDKNHIKKVKQRTEELVPYHNKYHKTSTSDYASFDIEGDAWKQQNIQNHDGQHNDEQHNGDQRNVDVQHNDDKNDDHQNDDQPTHEQHIDDMQHDEDTNDNEQSNNSQHDDQHDDRHENEQHNENHDDQHKGKTQQGLYDITETEEKHMRTLLQKLEQNTEHSHNTRSKGTHFEWNSSLNSKQVVLEKKD